MIGFMLSIIRSGHPIDIKIPKLFVFSDAERGLMNLKNEDSIIKLKGTVQQKHF
jgi:hypothetical protein